MTAREQEKPFTDEEAEKRATGALRRALGTPYKPQAALKLGKTQRARSAETKSKTPKSK